MAESCSNDCVDADDVGGGDGKRKVDCEGQTDDDDDGDNDKADCDDEEMVMVVIARMMGMRMVFLRIGVLMGKVVMTLMMVMSKLRVLHVALLNVVEVPKWK